MQIPSGSPSRRDQLSRRCSRSSLTINAPSCCRTSDVYTPESNSGPPRSILARDRGHPDDLGNEVMPIAVAAEPKRVIAADVQLDIDEAETALDADVQYRERSPRQPGRQDCATSEPRRSGLHGGATLPRPGLGPDAALHGFSGSGPIDEPASSCGRPIAP